VGFWVGSFEYVFRSGIIVNLTLFLTSMEGANV